MRRAQALITALVLLSAASAQARPDKGFNTGPYLAFEAGVSQTEFDTQVNTGRKIGNDFEPSFGVLFGWNIYDWFSTELLGRYSTDDNGGSRVHYATANVGTKWFLTLNALTDFPTLRILPFAKVGMGVNVASLPYDPGAGTSKLTTVGLGPYVGAGVAFNWKKYFYFGIDAHEDFLFFSDKRRTVGGVPGTLVYRGGFHPSFAALGFIGVHY